ncbi:MAG: helix-hairpin-helix domain-containing protein, partial [Sphingobacteriia bacterium]|nr:helix-hairpin-helix domain-containing protein [Sphingobacteriia bacterium]
MITKVIFFMLLLGGVNLAFAQLPDSADAEINLLIEDAMTTSDNQNSEQDWTILTDYLQDLRRKPLNLNQASKEDLSPIPGFTDVLISRLFTHIQNFGPLTSIYELQAIEGFTPEIFTAIGPYIKVEEISKYDISNRFQHPAGPPVHELLKGMKFEVTQRYSTIIEEQKGYTPPDTNSSGQLNTRYLGGQVRSFTRFRARYGQNFSFSMVGEKDAGEKFTWKPDNNQYGYDFVSGHLAIRNYKNLKCLTLGDYTIQYGQGLVLSGGIGFGKSSEVILTLKRPNFGIRPYTSINEFTYYRGGAAAYAIGRVNLIGFASIRGVDANLSPASAGDSIVTSEDILVSSLNQSGLHRTPGELETRNNITERAAGGRVEYVGKSFTIGTSFLQQEFSKPILKGTKPYQQYDFGGNSNFVNGLDWDWVIRNLNLFGEVARSESGGIGATASVLAAIDPKMDVAIQVRHFDRDFH